MMNKDLNDSLELLDNELKKQGLSRRDALKVAGLGSAAFLLGGTEIEAATSAQASDVKAKIVIVGGGLAGVATAARLTNSLSNPDITIIEPNPKSVSYQPGNTLIASGVYTKDDIMYNTNEYLPKGVKLIADYAVEFDPDNNKLTTKSGEVVTYDFLVIAAGLKLDFGRIKGLEAIGEAYTLGDSSLLLNTFANSGVSSIYTVDGAVATWNNMQKFVNDAKSGKKVKGVFTDPNTPIKCGGAPKKIMYLTNARLNEAGARANAELTFYPNGGKMFGVPEYHEAILQQFKDRDFKWNYAHNLTGVDLENKIATFDHHWKEKGEYDQDLEEYTMVTKNEDVQVEFDFLHITPPQKAPDEIGNSPLGSSKGWVPVDKETLQHVKYPNVFSIGDIAAVPMGKTGGSVRKQYKALVDNLIAAMEGKPLTSKYDGYTVCPLITDIGKVMLAEFNWTGKPTPSFPLDPTQERYIWWLLKVYMLKPMTMHGMLSGKA
ncbi:MAG: sulfide:quinone reductase [Deltaproteobacteria bacterium HGW-Deltaproteobacteria-24]|jgi:sulfide:quinone oxidoreductase|nr:MAG: sulfide:quinone reductase [Deltaproteobacteria bacterium HGW-Deltaproteobacteria-24]